MISLSNTRILAICILSIWNVILTWTLLFSCSSGLSSLHSSISLLLLVSFYLSVVFTPHKVLAARPNSSSAARLSCSFLFLASLYLTWNCIFVLPLLSPPRRTLHFYFWNTRPLLFGCTSYIPFLSLVSVCVKCSGLQVLVVCAEFVSQSIIHHMFECQGDGDEHCSKAHWSRRV